MMKTIKLKENIEVKTIISLRKEINKALKKSNSIEFDLSDIDFIDSSGINLLLNLANKLKRKEGELSFSNVKKPVMELFELTDLDKIARILWT